MPVSRRDALKTLGAASSVAAFAQFTASGAIAAPTAKLKGAIKQSVCRGPFKRLMPMEDFCKAVAEMGIVGIDLVRPDDWDVVRDHGLVATMAPGAGGIKSGLNIKSKHAEHLEKFKTSIKAAAKYGWPNVICMAGDREGIADDVGMDNCEVILKEAVKIAEDSGVTICMELLNSRVNHKGYMCDKSDWGFKLCRRVGSPRFKMLYDIYHMQIMEGDVIRRITDGIEWIGHFHTAGNPGRRDLDNEQELNYPPIMRAIAKLTGEGKFDGYVAHEFQPKNGMASLRHAVQLCDV